MNVWLVIGVVYVAVVLFALALCRVAAPVRRDDSQTGSCVTTPSSQRAEYAATPNRARSARPSPPVETRPPRHPDRVTVRRRSARRVLAQVARRSQR